MKLFKFLSRIALYVIIASLMTRAFASEPVFPSAPITRKLSKEEAEFCDFVAENKEILLPMAENLLQLCRAENPPGYFAPLPENFPDPSTFPTELSEQDYYIVRSGSPGRPLRLVVTIGENTQMHTDLAAVREENGKVSLEVTAVSFSAGAEQPAGNKNFTH